MLCPCHSTVPYTLCCKPYHDHRNAPTPLALMRSRYSAYALGNIPYILATTHPDHPDSSLPPKQRLAHLQHFCKNTTFNNLEILDSTPTTVTFRATLFQNGRDISFTEKSLFAQIDGRWLYVGPLSLH